MKKISIIGCSGSGKSTLSRKLHEKLNIPVYHLDAINWKPNWEATSREKFDKLQNKLVKKSDWIIDGNYNRTLNIRLEAADTIIFLDFPKWICIQRVIKRYLMYRNTNRPDMNEGCKEKLDFDFLKWIWNYNKNNKPGVLKLLTEKKSKKIIIIKSQKQVNEFISTL